MKKLLIITCVVLISCGSTTAPVKGDSGLYPMSDITDPNVAVLVHHFMEKGLKLVGAGQDITNTWLLWFEAPELNECIAILYIVETGDVAILDCQQALDGWNDCVANGECHEPSTNI